VRRGARAAARRAALGGGATRVRWRVDEGKPLRGGGIGETFNMTLNISVKSP